MKKFILYRDVDRYPGIKTDFPGRITYEGTLEQALDLAHFLSLENAGCNCSWVVEGHEDEGY